jgi:uncharacterized membrane protein YeaQ/YmgE (transglycosylase-associated protein family)
LDWKIGLLAFNVRHRTDYTGYREQAAIVVFTLELIMTLLVWVVLGLVSGLIASKIVNKSGEGFVWDIVLGIVGAVFGGWLFNTFGMAGVSGLNLYSFFVAIIGAMVVLVSYHFLVRRAR